LKLHKVIWFVLIIVLSFGLSACSEYGKKTNSTQIDSGTKNDLSQNLGAKGNDDGPRGPQAEAIITNDRLFTIGQNVIFDAGGNSGKIQYNVKKVEVFNNLVDGGLSVDKIYNQDKLSIDASGYLKDNLIFVRINIEVKNISFQTPNDEQNISLVNILYSSVEGQETTTPNYDYYFLNSTYQITEGKYYHYKLKIGDSTNLQIGWIIDTKKYPKEKLFLVIGQGAQNDWKSFISLGL